jgi:GNAT superfamily N-acetyltransferase
VDDAVGIEPLGPNHRRDRFDCGEPALNLYLQRRASQDARRRVAQVFVAVAGEEPELVIGYHALSAASFDRLDLPPEVARRLPNYPVPAALLGRLAGDRTRQGQGLGEHLLTDALHRVLRASVALAIHAVIVDAKGDRAARFYVRYGFRAFPSHPLRLFLPLETIAKSGL